MAATPSRFGARPAGGGYYADPYSPIASTPQKAPTKTATKLAPAPTPSAAALSPMKQPTEHARQRHVPEAAEAAPEGSWTNGIFSPVLKYFSNEGEEQGASAASAASSAGRPAAGPAVHTRGYAQAGSSSPSSIDNLRQRVAAVTVSDSPGAYGSSSGTPTHGSSSLTQLSSPGGRVQVGSSGAGAGNTTPSRSSANAAAAAAAQAAAQAAAAAAAAAAAQHAAAQAAAAQAAAAQAQAAQQAAAANNNTDEDGYEYEEFNPYLFIKLLPPYSSVAPRVPRIVLPAKRRSSPDVNLVLDLDETLVHCSVDPIPDPDVTFPVMFNGANYQVYVRKRPFLDRFFQSIAGKFEVTVFTASQQVYAEKLLNLLDPEGRYIQYRLYRDACLNVEGNYLKDLNVLGRDMSKTVLVDNSPHAFGYQLDNGIPIESWFEDPKDTELLKLSAFLHTLLGASDVRPLVRDKFRVHKLVEEAQVR